MTYNSSIPAAGNTPAADQPGMLFNFAQIKTFVGLEHNAISSGANNGKHKFITLKENPGAAAPIGTDIVLKKTRVIAPLIYDSWYAEMFDSLGKIWYVPLRRQEGPIAVIAGSHTVFLYDFANLYVGPNHRSIAGTIFLYDTTLLSRTLLSPFVLIDGNFRVPGTPGVGPAIPGHYDGQLASGTQFPGFETVGTQLFVKAISVPAAPPCTVQLLITLTAT